MVQVAGGGSGSNKGNLAQLDTPPSRAQHAARARTADTAQRTLVQTAGSAKPVEAGKAMRQLDQQNGGNRAATNQQVSTAKMNPSFLWGTSSLVSPLAPVSRTLDGTSEKDGVRTTTAGAEHKTFSLENTETQTKTNKTETQTGMQSWSQKTSVTNTTTHKTYDANGDPVVDKNGQPVETIDRKTQVNGQVKVDANSASAEISGSTQKGDYILSGSNKTVIDENGVTKSGQVSAGTDSTKVTGGGGVTVSEEGMTAFGQVGVNAGGLGVQHKGEYKAGPDGTETVNTTIGSFATPQDKLLSVKFEFKHSKSEKLTENADGSTTFKVTGETKISGSVGADIKKVEIDASWSQGQRSIYTITVPKGVDVKSVDPTNPDTWETGTRVMIKSEDYTGSSLGVAYAGFGVEGSAETREGNAIVMEKNSATNVSVAAGPTSGFTNNGKLKFDVGAGFSAELGATNKVDFAFYKTFNIDLSASGGAQTLANVIAGQKAPEQNADGVSNLMDTTTGDWNYTGSAQINTPFGSFGPEHKESSNSVWKTYADGHVEYSRSYDANGDGKAELTKTAISPDGKTWNDPVYKLTVEITTEDNSQLHNAKQYVPNDALKVGDKIEITLTAKDMYDLRQKHTSFYTQGTETKEVKGNLNDSFADFIARSGGTDAILSELFLLKTSNKAYDYTSKQPKVDLNHPLPGDVKVISG